MMIPLKTTLATCLRITRIMLFQAPASIMTTGLSRLYQGKPRLPNCFDYVKADRQRHFPSTDILFRQGIDALYSIQR